MLHTKSKATTLSCILVTGLDCVLTQALVYESQPKKIYSTKHPILFLSADKGTNFAF